MRTTADRDPGSRRIPARQMSTRTPIVSWLWAIAPFLTFGLATPVIFLLAAQRVRSRHLVIAAAVYTVLVVLGVVVLDDNIASVLFTTVWLAGTAHALAVRSSVFRTHSAPQDPGMEAAMEATRARRGLRGQARAIAAEDPRMARELRIGRPDVQRSFDDGGLVDVNSAPAEVLARLPGLTAEMAERVVQVRETRGPYGSVDELSVFADLPPGLAERLAEFFLFLAE